jgi:hypothetical protein
MGGKRTSQMPVFDMPSAQTLRTLSLVAVAVICAAGGPSSSENGHRAAAEPSLRASLQNYVSNRWGRPDGDTNYTAKFVDLNGDGRSEAVVLVSGQHWCGTGGCPLWVLTPRNQSWSMVTQAPIVRAPIRLLPSRSRGWSDLSAMLRFDGARPLYEARLSVNGRLNPTITPLARQSLGQVILSESDESEPLFP